MRCLARPLRAAVTVPALRSGPSRCVSRLAAPASGGRRRPEDRLEGRREGRRRCFSTTTTRTTTTPPPRDDGQLGRADDALPPLTDADIARLAKEPEPPIRMADLVRYGWPPLGEEALLQSANFALERIPVRLARRLQALRNLPYIVVSNAHVRQIYGNYHHSLRSLLPWWRRRKGDAAAAAIASPADERAFAGVLAALVATHQNTIPVLAQGLLESRKYMAPADVTAFLDAHLRARIGTRLVAEQHLALRSGEASSSSSPHHIGILDTQLRPARTLDQCAGFVADICELRYGVRPRWRVDGAPATTLAYVPMHLEYVVTELLKNAFRAVVENRMHREPVVVTIAPEPSPSGGAAPAVTIRIRDRGGGISPDVLPNIWSYSFSTFSADDDPSGDPSDGATTTMATTTTTSTTTTPPPADGLNIIAASSSGASSIAGLGYGLPLSRAYAEYFGGGIAVQSLYGWGTDVYLRLKGVDHIAPRPSSH